MHRESGDIRLVFQDRREGTGKLVELVGATENGSQNCHILDFRGYDQQ